MKDMLAELNQMLEARARGEEPDFDGLHGALRRLLPREPAEPRRAAGGAGPAHGRHAGDAGLDDARAAGRRSPSWPSSCSSDMDLRWQVDQLGAQLRGMFPDMGWDRRYDFRGQDPLGMAEAAVHAGGAGRPRPARAAAAGRRQPGRPGRGRHRPGPRAAGRRRRPQPRRAGPAGPHAAGGRAHRPARGPPRAHAQGPAPHRPQRPARPVRSA